MVGATNEPIVEMLRRIKADTSEFKADVRGRVGHIEVQLASLETRVVDLSDRDDRIERMMRRLDFTDAPH